MGLFDFLKPKTIIVDNKAWVKVNSKHIDKDDVEGTFDFVQSHHPLQGCAQSEMPKLYGNETVGTLAELADAVTVACYVVLGYGNEAESAGFEEYNETAVGNLAYISIKHPDASIRKKHHLMLKAWRAYMGE